MNCFQYNLNRSPLQLSINKDSVTTERIMTIKPIKPVPAKYMCDCICMFICINMCVYVWKYVNVCIFVPFVYLHVCMCAYVCTCLYVCKQACMDMFLCFCGCACLCTCTCACLFAFMYMCNGSLVYVLKLQLSWFAKMHRIVKITTLQPLRHIELRYIC